MAAHAPEYDAIIIGLGAMGAAAAMHMAFRGRRVLGLEQFSILHARGSHHGHTRMIRLAYYEHPDYVPLLRRAWDLWQDLERRAQRRLLHVTGGLYMGEPEREFIRASRDAAVRHGLPHEMLSRAALAARYPQFHVPREFAALFEPMAGALLCEDAVAAHAEQALRAGADLRGHEEALDWSADERGVEVRTPRGAHRAKTLIFTAGAWTSRLLRDLGVELTVTRQPVGWVWPKRPEMFGLGALPCWAIENDDGSLHYGFPMLPDRPGLKIARHVPGAPCEPAPASLEARAEDEADWRPALERYMPDGAGPTLARQVCMYTNTPDAHFIIDRHPNHANVLIAAGFSGHGFKFAPVVGEALAEMALSRGEESSLPIGFLSLSRFRGAPGAPGLRGRGSAAGSPR